MAAHTQPVIQQEKAAIPWHPNQSQALPLLTMQLQGMALGLCGQ